MMDSYVLLLGLMIHLLISWVSSDNNINPQPKQLVNAENLGRSFRGNGSKSDHFKLLVRDGNYLLVGARNAVYNLSLDTLSLQKEDCHNYIRVMVKQSDGKILICGTNAFQPLCRQYVMNDDSSLQVQREFSGYAISPYDPQHNSTAHYIPESDELYTGSVSDFTGSDPLIYRKPLSGPTSEMRTMRNDLKCLNEPNFVSSFSDESNVYFWFRETAAEYMDHGRQVYGRVARVCKRDQGSPSNSRHRHNSLGIWTTFVKARLNCSLPGQIPFYFNELQATTNVILSRYGGSDASLVYAVFSTPYNGIQASAVCAFSLEDIRNVFNKGAFKHQPDSSSLWQPLAKSTVPNKRPGSCDTSAKTLTDDMINFIHRNSLMHEAVPSFFSRPLFIDTNLKSLMTQIAVHKARTVDGALYDVLFVGTSDGRVLKLIVNGLHDGSTSLVDSVHVFANREPIRNLLVYDPSEVDQRRRTSWDSDGYKKGSYGMPDLATTSSRNMVYGEGDGFTRRNKAKLVVVSQDEVKTVPLHYCSNESTCSACVRLRDPYCAWDLAAGRCVGVTDGVWPNDRKFVQNIRTSQPLNCPIGELDEELYSAKNLYALSTSNSDAHSTVLVYSAESMALAVVLTMTCALTAGFCVGYRFSSCRRRETDDRRLAKNRSLTNVDDLLDDDYEAPPSYKTRASDFYASTLDALHHNSTTPNNKFALSLGVGDCCYSSAVSSTPCKKDSVNNASSEAQVNCCKASLTSPMSLEKNLLPPPPVLNNGTLPKDYKVKKVYL